ncbi:Putative Ubiquitin-conjugating enzyme E2 S [Rhizopus microsporus]|nr:Putative Ubiquitin-conjugating enzyme E2 S [Rhizopus microsporus]
MTLTAKAIKLIAKELEKLQSDPPEDIQVIANEESLTELHCWIRGPDKTPYEDGYFKIKLVFDENFPDSPPKGYFMTKIFHPNVSDKGEICVNTLKKDWKPELGIRHVLLAIKCLLIVPNPESALNEEAGKLLLEQEITIFAPCRTKTKGKSIRSTGSIKDTIKSKEAFRRTRYKEENG